MEKKNNYIEIYTNISQRKISNNISLGIACNIIKKKYETKNLVI